MIYYTNKKGSSRFYVYIPDNLKPENWRVEKYTVKDSDTLLSTLYNQYGITSIQKLKNIQQGTDVNIPFEWLKDRFENYSVELTDSTKGLIMIFGALSTLYFLLRGKK